MLKAGQTFRLFVSSTFSDLIAERNALQKHVFPRLRDLCMREGCRFQVIDLRWGISEEASLDQQTMPICLSEIARCQKITPRPNFLVLLGERYGWRPLPHEIAAEEYREIEQRLADEKKALLATWYERDDNAVPPVCFLKARKKDTPEEDYATWERTVERPLRDALEAATADMALSPNVRLKYGAAATEQEIWAGALDPGVSDAQEHVFAFFRKIRDLPPDANAFVDADENARARLERLKERLRQRLRKQVIEYSVGWADLMSPLDDTAIGATLDELAQSHDAWSAPSVPYLQKFCADVFLSVGRIIQGQMRQTPAVDPLTLEISHHRVFAAERTRVFVGQHVVLSRIRDYLGGPSGHPLVIVGPPGSGKSALMAKATLQAGSFVIARFVGSTPTSSDVRLLLKFLCEEISAKCDREGQKRRRLAEVQGADDQARKERRAIENDFVIPEDTPGLSQAFGRLLQLVPQDRQLEVFVDALDQVATDDSAPRLAWLPRDLPAHVHVVVSTLPGQCLQALERIVPASHHVQLSAMSRATGDQILSAWLAEVRRTLGTEQRDEVLTRFAASGLPFYLKLAFEEARHWRSSESVPTLPTDVRSLLNRFFDRIEKPEQHGETLVSRVLGYLGVARKGLTDDEMLDLLSRDDEFWTGFLQRSHHAPPETRLPVIVWSRLYADLEPYLAQRSGDGTSLLSFYHQLVAEVAAERYLIGDERLRAHRTLAEYFNAQYPWLESLEEQRARAGCNPPTPRPVNLRRAGELCWHRLHGTDIELLTGLLMDPHFLESKAEAGLIFELIAELEQATYVLPRECPTWRLLRLLKEAIARDAHFLSRHPTTLFQCLWNSCWWYDSTHSSRHYVGAAGETPISISRPRLCTWMENWRATKEATTPSFSWLRSLRPCRMPLGSGQQLVLGRSGYRKEVRFMRFFPDGRRILSISDSDGVRVWDSVTGELLLSLPNLREAIAFALDGHAIACGDASGGGVYDATTGSLIFHYPARYCHLATPSPDGRFFVFDSIEGPLQVVDVQNGGSRITLRWPEPGPPTMAVFSPDGRRIACASTFKWGDCPITARVWDTSTGQEQCSMQWPEDTNLSPLLFSADSSCVITAHAVYKKWHWLGWKGIASIYSPLPELFGGHVQTIVRAWGDTCEGRKRILRGHSALIDSVTVSSDSRRIATASRDTTVRVWDLATGTEQIILRGHEDAVKHVTFSPDNRLIASSSDDATVRVWDAGSGTPVCVLRGHEDKVSCVEFSPDGRRIASASADGTVRVWDTDEAGRDRVLRGHRDRVWAIAFSPDGRGLVSSACDNTARLWDAQTGTETHLLEGHRGAVGHVLFSPDSTRVATASEYDGTVRLWSAHTGRLSRVMPASAWLLKWLPPWELLARVESVCFSPDGRWLAAIHDHAPKVRNGRRFPAPALRVRFVASGAWLRLAAFFTRLVGDRLENRRTRVLRGEMQGHHGYSKPYPMGPIAFSPDGALLACGCADTFGSAWSWSPSDDDWGVCIWHMSTDKAFYFATGDIVESLHFCRAGTAIAAVMRRGGVRTWDVRTGALLQASNDPRDPAAVALDRPFQAVAHEGETSFERYPTGECLAWWPVPLQYIATHPIDPRWAGVAGSDLHLIALEGGSNKSRPPWGNDS